jgi:hypothetical protein
MKHFAHILVALTTCLLASGFVYYFLAPLNWGAGELIMHFHLWIGLLFALYLGYAIPKHIKSKKAKCNRKVFVYISYLLSGVFFITIASGLMHFIPYISYFFQPLYYRFETYDLISFIHLVSAVVVTLLFVVHLYYNKKECK